MSLFLSEKDVEQLLSMPMVLEASRRRTAISRRGRLAMCPGNVPACRRRPCIFCRALCRRLDAIGYKAYTSNRSGVRFLVHLYRASSGSLRAVIEADRLGMMRTGAAAGIATRWLARSDAQVAGVFGAGWQAEGHIEALAAVRPLRRVKVFARHAEKLAAFCARMSARLGIEVIAAVSPEDVVRGSDIVSTVTTSATPLFNAEWLSPGTHVNAAGSNSLIRRELGEDVLKRCSPIVVDSVETALREAGDLLPCWKRGACTRVELLELGEVICGRHAGRSTDDQITLFESQGMAIQDLAVAVRLEELARERGVGVELPYGS
jgi:alanine dehydrogenase